MYFSFRLQADAEISQHTIIFNSVSEPRQSHWVPAGPILFWM